MHYFEGQTTGPKNDFLKEIRWVMYYNVSCSAPPKYVEMFCGIEII